MQILPDCSFKSYDGSRKRLAHFSCMIKFFKCDCYATSKNRNEQELVSKLDHAREMRKSLREIHAELLEAYNQAKTVRRHLRAQLGTVVAVAADAQISAESYDREMDLLSDELTFEIYKTRAEDTALFFRSPTSLSDSLDKVEQYLNNIIKEYRSTTSFSGEQLRCEISKLPKLVEFIGPYKQAVEYKNDFKEPIQESHGSCRARLPG